jgi:hypothetical protein
MKRPALFLFLFTGLLACDTPTSSPTPRGLTPTEPLFEQAIQETRMPVSGVVFNPCPPAEGVAFEGFVHLHATGDVEPPDFDAKVHFNAQDVKGVGLVTGDTYSIQQNVKNDVSVQGPVVDQTLDNRFRLIRHGSLDNLWFRFKARFTAPPATIEIKFDEIECRGPTGGPL